MTSTPLAPTPPLSTVRGLVGEQWITSPGPEPLLSPFNGATVTSVHPSSTADVDAAVAAAHASLSDWWKLPAYRRAELLHRITDRLDERREEFAAQMTAETGRPPAEARGEVARSVTTLRLTAEEATRINGEVVPMDAIPAGADKLGFTMLTPVGVVAAITPFNAPLNTICHKLGPALAGGNAVVLKPHHHGSGAAALLAELCLDAGLPPGLFQLVHGDADIGRHLTTHSDIDFVNFTGSGAVAERIVGEIGLKRSLLELGGNAPTIVHHDADLPRAVADCANAAFGLSGQSCISTQRIYLHADIVEEFTANLVDQAAARNHPSGAGIEGGTGPLLNEESAIRVEQWVREAERDGARLLYGGQRNFTYVEPTILADVPAQARVACEEIFGPVVVLYTYTDIGQALDRANDSPWGLKSGVFTNSLNLALRSAKELAFGTVNINASSRSRVDQEPSGGIKKSGWGKEGPYHAIREMMTTRMISVHA